MPAPRRSNNDAADLTSAVLVVIARSENENKGTEIRVVDWIKADKHWPQLEKREFFKDDVGNWKMGKAKGMNGEDVIVVLKNLDKIMPALKINPDLLKSVLMGVYEKIGGAAPASAPAPTQPAAPAPARSAAEEEQEF